MNPDADHLCRALLNLVNQIQEGRVVVAQSTWTVHHIGEQTLYNALVTVEPPPAPLTLFRDSTYNNILDQSESKEHE